MNRIKINDHRSVAELEQRYRQSSEGIARTPWQMLWLLAQGKPTEEVAALTGSSIGWVRQIVRRYNPQGPDGLGDQRHDNPGGQFLLTPAQQAALKEALSGSAPDAGLWNSRTVPAWMSEQVGRRIRRQRGWDYLQRLDFSLQKPRRQHKKADPDAQEAFKGGAHRRREQTHFLLLSRVNTTLYNQALCDFAQSIGAGWHKQIVLLVDGAGWHRSHAVLLPLGLHLVFLPPYSPELQPAQRLWPLTNEAIANRHFETLEDWQAAQIARCQALDALPQPVRSYTLFHG